MTTPTDLLVEAIAERVAELVIDRLADLVTQDAGPAPLLDTAGVARFLAVSEPTVRKLRREGMPHLRLGEAVRFDVERVRSWLEERSREK